MFVCTGNTCRSPMAEMLLRHKIKQNRIKWWDVLSCGINAEVGGAISHNSAAALAELGIDSKNFAPRQLTQKLIEKSTVVICMTQTQKTLLEDCGNVVSVKDLCGFDVLDPYGCGVEVYRQTRNMLSKACDIIIKNYILKYKEET